LKPVALPQYPRISAPTNKSNLSALSQIKRRLRPRNYPGGRLAPRKRHRVHIQAHLLQAISNFLVVSNIKPEYQHSILCQETVQVILKCDHQFFESFWSIYVALGSPTGLIKFVLANAPRKIDWNNIERLTIIIIGPFVKIRLPNFIRGRRWRKHLFKYLSLLIQLLLLLGILVILANLPNVIRVLAMLYLFRMLLYKLVVIHIIRKCPFCYAEYILRNLRQSHS